MNAAPASPPAPTGVRNPRRRIVRVLVAVGVVCLTLALLATWALHKAAQSTRDKVTLGGLRQLSSAADQLFLEFPSRLFLEYEDLVGPGRYISIVHPVQGEDLRQLFPLRRDFDWDHVVLTLPDGRKLGAAFETQARPDGVEVVPLPEKGGRFETTYQGGIADGPFRAYYPDGKLWGEATYVKGRVAGPRLIHLPGGQTYDETLVGTAAVSAELGRKKYLGRDFSGAITDLTQAVGINPSDSELWRLRAEAQRELGQLEAALADYTVSLEVNPYNLVYYRRAHVRRLRHDLPGAAADFLAAIGTDTLSERYNPAVFWLYLTTCEQGHAEEAATRLSASIGKMRNQKLDWESRLGEFLLGRISEDQLLAQKPRDAGEVIQARFFSAMRLQLAGDRAGALPRFREVLTRAGPASYRGEFDDTFVFEVAEARRAVGENAH